MRQLGLILYLLAAAIPSNHSLISDESAVVLAAARVGRAGEPRKLVNTTGLPVLNRKGLRGAMALPKPMHNMEK